MILRLKRLTSLVVFTTVVDDYTPLGMPYPSLLVQNYVPHAQIIDAQELADLLVLELDPAFPYCAPEVDGFLVFYLLEQAGFQGKLSNIGIRLGYRGREINLFADGWLSLQELAFLTTQQPLVFSEGTKRLLAQSYWITPPNEKYINKQTIR
jgi:hypothetical protein